MPLFDPNIFDPNIFLQNAPSGGLGARAKRFLHHDPRIEKRAISILAASKTIQVVTFKPHAFKYSKAAATVDLEKLDTKALIAREKALLESILEDKPVEETEPIFLVEDGFIDVLYNEMLEESFRQDIIQPSIKGSVEDAVSSTWLGNFQGLNRDQSLYARDILQDAFIKNASHSATIDRLQRFVGIPYEQAKLIVDTEFQQIRNRARVLAYKDTETEDSRYIWDTQRDHHVCRTCETIKRNTLPGGVTMSELLDIIRNAQYEFGSDTARRYIAHVGDRCRIARLR